MMVAMHGRRRRLFFLATAVLVLLAGLSIAADPALPFRAKKGHVAVHTDISRGFALGMAAFLYAAHKPMGRLPGFHQSLPRRRVRSVTAYVFKDQETYTAGMGTRRRGSFCLRWEGGGKMYVRGVPGDEYETRRRALHELTHIYLRATPLGSPVDEKDSVTRGFEEHICDVVSWHEWDGRKFTLQLCRAKAAPPIHRRPLVALLSSDGGVERTDFAAPLSCVSSTQGRQYAIAHFLMTNRTIRRPFMGWDFLRRKRVRPAAAAKRAFARHRPALDDAFQAHCAELTRILALNGLKATVGKDAQ